MQTTFYKSIINGVVLYGEEPVNKVKTMNPIVLEKQMELALAEERVNDYLELRKQYSAAVVKLQSHKDVKCRRGKNVYAYEVEVPRFSNGIRIN